MDESLAIILVSFYGVILTLLFVCSVLFCRMSYIPISFEEN